MQTATSERISEPYLGGAAWGTGFALPSENRLRNEKGARAKHRSAEQVIACKS